jgi:glycosyltransferase involved in cell wall biosynthesis
MPDNNVLVSVIVPNYNHEPFLKSRIDSILRQTYADYEVIILDDCSTDKSRAVIESYRNHPKVTHIVYNTVNSGSTFLQWEKGFGLASGAFVWIAESDDYCEPTLLEELMAPVLHDPSIAVSYCQSILFTKNNEIHWRTEAGYLYKMESGSDWVRHYMLGKNSLVNASMAIFRKELVAKIDKSYLDYKLCGDWLFWILLALEGNVFISGKYLNYYRVHEQTVRNKTWREGYYYSEAASIYEVVASKLSVAPQERERAVQTLLTMYFKDEDKFSSGQVRAEALKILK